MGFGSSTMTEYGPAHTVTVGQFCMDLTEVTAAAYQQCVDAGWCPARFTNWMCNEQDRPDYPANCVTWAQADAYCRWAMKRLPTEAEWELAARGPSGRVYPWGNQWCPTCSCDDDPVPSTGTCLVGSYPSGDSPLGVHDLIGNVAEWTADSFCYYVDPGCVTTQRAVRGGAAIGGVQAGYGRIGQDPLTWGPGNGFRCVE